MNEKAYVLSSDLSPLPIGAIGELYIGGVGLARGYLNNPELNCKKILYLTFSSQRRRMNVTKTLEYTKLEI